MPLGSSSNTARPHCLGYTLSEYVKNNKSKKTYICRNFPVIIDKEHDNRSFSIFFISAPLNEVYLW